jgi:hypothetical protein
MAERKQPTGTPLGGQSAPDPTLAAMSSQLAPGDQNAKAVIDRFLRDYGLEGLGSWAWNHWKRHGSIELLKLEMEDRPEYKARFRGRLALRERGIMMSEAEQIAYEKGVAEQMRAAGMPPGFYDSPDDFQDLIARGLSPAEVSERINDAYAKVAQAPVEIRQAMQEYYGAYGDAALAAFALDASKAAPAIMREVAAAEAGGYLTQQGIKVQRELAQRIAIATQNNSQLIRQGAVDIGKKKDLFDSQFGEAGLSVETAAESIYNGNADATRQIDRAIDIRRAQTEGGGGFEVSSTGATGLGKAND